MLSRQFLNKEDNWIFFDKETIEKARNEGFETIQYVNTKLSKKKLWKRAGFVLP